MKEKIKDLDVHREIIRIQTLESFYRHGLRSRVPTLWNGHLQSRKSPASTLQLKHTASHPCLCFLPLQSKPPDFLPQVLYRLVCGLLSPKSLLCPPTTLTHNWGCRMERAYLPSPSLPVGITPRCVLLLGSQSGPKRSHQKNSHPEPESSPKGRSFQTTCNFWREAHQGSCSLAMRRPWEEYGDKALLALCVISSACTINKGPSEAQLGEACPCHYHHNLPKGIQGGHLKILHPTLPGPPTWASYYLLSISFTADPQFQRDPWIQALKPPRWGDSSPHGADTESAFSRLSTWPLPRSAFTRNVPAEVLRSAEHLLRWAALDTSPGRRRWGRGCEIRKLMI